MDIRTQDFRPNFSLADNCLAFQITSQILEETLEKAQKEGRKYGWTFLSDDYWLPEKNSFDYELGCPIWCIESNFNKKSKSITTFLNIQNSLNDNQRLYFVRCFQTSGQPKISEWISISKMVSYLRYSERDFVRKQDIYWWNSFSHKNIISNETVLIWSEDKFASDSWAQRNFSHNPFNALVGKCGEFVFSYWAGECDLMVSQVDLNDHPEGDESDFFSFNFLIEGKRNLKIDIKTFQVCKEQKRDWWTISSYCLNGKHK